MRAIASMLALGLAGGAGYFVLANAGLVGAGALTTCSADFPGGAAPSIAGASVKPICFHHYAVGFSPDTLTPLWSAEKLTGAATLQATQLPREDDFHPEPSLSGGPRAELSDYRRTGFDRGHMTPSGDMPDAQSQDESFSLANVVPQDRENNRHVWADIEMSVRRLAREVGTIYVVTGPIIAPNPARLHGRVAIPVAFYKAVYVPGQGAAAYLSNNVAARNWRETSIASLVSVGIDPFPGLAQSEKDAMVKLPVPKGRYRDEQ